MTATFSAADGGAGVAYTESRLDGGPWAQTELRQISSPGAHTLSYRSVDKAGNVEAAHDVSVSIDGTAPQTTSSADGMAWSTASPVLVSLSAADDHTGVTSTDYRLDGGGWTEGTSVSVAGELDHVLEYRSVDGAGNVETAHIVHVPIDLTDPTASFDVSGATPVNGFYAAFPTVRVGGSDATSGLALRQYRWHATDPWQEMSAQGMLLDIEGSVTLRYRTVDNAGRTSVEQTADLAVDCTAPATTVTGAPAGWARKPVVLTLEPSDTVAGVASLTYQIGDTAPAELPAEGGTVTVPAPSSHAGDGEHLVQAWASDLAGNTETPVVTTVRIDTVRPATRAPYRAAVVAGRTATLKYRVNDAKPCAGKASVRIEIRTLHGRLVKTVRPGLQSVGTLRSATFRCRLARGTYRFTVLATDPAGNVTSKASAGANRLVVR